MALTQGAWTTKSVEGFKVMECDVTATTAENDAYTLVTPVELDGTKPWTLIINSAGATLDATTLPVDLWIGTSRNLVLSGDGANVVATDGFNFKAIVADVQAAAVAVLIDPTLVTADVANVHVKAPAAPAYAINLDGGSTLAAATCHFIIMQKG